MNANSEEWRDIPGYEGLYQVSSLGMVKSLTRFDRMKRVVAGRIMTPVKTHHGYTSLSLSSSGKTKKFLIHRLVAAAFLPNPENKPEIDHIDGNRKNNRLDNLRWVTGEENMQNPVTVERVWNGIKKYQESLKNAKGQ